VHLDHVSIPTGNGRIAEKTKGKSLHLMSGIKNSIVIVKAAFLFLTHAFIIVMSRANCDPRNKSYINAYGVKELVEGL